MIYLTVVILFILLKVLVDLNYFVRTIFTVLSSRIYQQKISLTGVTSIYGICTLEDCDISLRNLRFARILRDLDFARYHFYELTGIYRRSCDLNIVSLQGCTYSITFQPVPIFTPYKINTKLIYWDSKSLFLEHEVVTLHDGKIREFLLSRQHAIGNYSEPAAQLLTGLCGSKSKQICPEYVKYWLKSMEFSSSKLRKNEKELNKNL